jgi:tripartite-type tricarboxylate transporter receptor subunit TctC
VDSVVRARPDGYTLLLTASPDSYDEKLYPGIKFNYIRDISPVATIGVAPLVMEVNPSFPSKTVPEFINYAKANPGKINFASAGVGSSQHLCGELFNIMTGVQMAHVPYRGDAPAITDLLAGQVQVFFGNLPASIEYVRIASLRALAVTSATRLEVLPNIPTVADFVPGFEATVWTGIGAPKDTPAAIIDKLNSEINTALSDPKINARYADLGVTVLAQSPANFGKLVAQDTGKWRRLLQVANIKAE